MVFQDKIWVAGGDVERTTKPILYEERFQEQERCLWSTADGKQWTRVSSQAP